jgi:hypothetical protein
LGGRGFTSFLQDRKLDGDYFSNLNASINFNFTIDLAEVLIKKTGLHNRDAEIVTRNAGEGLSHGSLKRYYDFVYGRQFQLVTAFIENASRYGSYFDYEILDASPSKMEIAVKPKPQLKGFEYREHPVLGDFLAYYDKGYLQNFSSYGGQSPLKATLIDNHYQGAARSVYRLSAAASISRKRDKAA